ncbi:MAG: hypothetical protein ABFC89_07945 [Methanospirillum sp.]
MALLRYRFDLTIQAAYGMFGFLVSLAVLYLVLGQLSVVTAFIIGIGNFLVAGFSLEYARQSVSSGRGEGLAAEECHRPQGFVRPPAPMSRE